MKFFFLWVPFFISCSPIVPLENPLERNATVQQERIAKTLKIIVLDVGQGDATLVVGPDGRTLLIDAGPPGAGDSKILPTLHSMGINLHWMMATHYDADHIGGMAEIFKDKIPSLGLIDRGDHTDQDSPVFFEFTQLVDDLFVQEIQAEPGLEIFLGDGAVANVIVVNGNYSDGRKVHLNPDEENESSIGLLIEYGNFKYFTSGDLTGGGSSGSEIKKDLETIAGEIIGDIDILHINHHGSQTSSAQGFLDLTQPEALMISVGRDNDYGHPAESVMERLIQTGAMIYRTDLMGDIEILSDGEAFEIFPQINPS